jgi:hypothetical protein
MYGTERHILSNYMVQCRKKNGEYGKIKDCASFTRYQNNYSNKISVGRAPTKNGQK